jgi:hypothetical protein
VESVSLTKYHGTYSEEGVTAYYAEWTYTLTFTEEADYRGFHEELLSVEDEVGRINPLTNLDLLSSLRGLWERKQGLSHRVRDVLRKGTVKYLFDGKPPEI